MIRAIILASSAVTPKVSSYWRNQKGTHELKRNNQLLEYTEVKQVLAVSLSEIETWNLLFLLALASKPMPLPTS